MFRASSTLGAVEGCRGGRGGGGRERPPPAGKARQELFRAYIPHVPELLSCNFFQRA
jgi:hypothetical protein